MKRYLCRSVLVAIVFVLMMSTGSFAAEDNVIRVFTWDGYVLAEEVAAVNKLLGEKEYSYNVEVIKPWAEGPEQMFKVLRTGKADISFLTLNYI